MQTNRSAQLISLSILVIILLLSNSTYSQSIRKINKDLRIIEDKNFIKLNEKLYAYKYEATNSQYLMFLTEKTQDKIEKLGIGVDTTNWDNRLSEGYHDNLTDLYLPHPAYANYPVVNVRYEGAVEFCKWLTEKYNANPKRKFKKVEIRLPSPEEWDTMHKIAVINDEKPKCYINEENELSDYATPDNVSTYKEAGKFYGVYSNVREMTNVKGLAKGYSYFWKNKNKSLDSKYEEKSNTYTGFRIFMEVIEK